MQLDGSDHVEPLENRLSETTEIQSAKLVCGSSPTTLSRKSLFYQGTLITLVIIQVKATATNVDVAVRELPDANTVRYINL